MQSTDDKVIAKIKKAKRSSLFFTEDFLNFGTSKAIAKALERLAEKQEITRVARGIYARLQLHHELGLLYPSTEAIINATWLNDRDQFLFPNDGWQTDNEFQTNCLAFTLFNSQNKISSNESANHWIPFTEQEVNAQAKFASNFMTDFIKRKIKLDTNENNLFEASNSLVMKPLEFSVEATTVFDAGRELWQYYHTQKDVNVNASLYDIREYFQGRNVKGRMNSKSEDAIYMKLIGELRSKLSILADKIKPKVYEYEFLKE